MIEQSTQTPPVARSREEDLARQMWQARRGDSQDCGGPPRLLGQDSSDFSRLDFQRIPQRSLDVMLGTLLIGYPLGCCQIHINSSEQQYAAATIAGRRCLGLFEYVMQALLLQPHAHSLSSQHICCVIRALIFTSQVLFPHPLDHTSDRLRKY